jgi:hypothetical protein
LRYFIHFLNVCHSGHKDPRSLLSYDPDLDPLQKLDMMAAVAQGGAGQRGWFKLTVGDFNNIVNRRGNLATLCGD